MIIQFNLIVYSYHIYSFFTKGIVTWLINTKENLIKSCQLSHLLLRIFTFSKILHVKIRILYFTWKINQKYQKRNVWKLSFFRWIPLFTWMVFFGWHFWWCVVVLKGWQGWRQAFDMLWIHTQLSALNT